MPNFVTNSGEEVYMGSARPVFRRGERLDDATIRRLRDIWFMQLASLGCSSEDISRTTQACVSSRQVRNRTEKHMPLDFKKAMMEIAQLILSEVKPLPKRRPKRQPRAQPTYRQLTLFDEGEADARLG